MHGDGFFFQAFVYLAAAVVAVPIAKRLGLGSVIGYLAAGAVIGPFALGLVGQEGEGVMHFAEFGVVMMLFLVGLELEPSMLWRMRKPMLGLGGLQVGVTSAVLAGICVLLGLSWQTGLAVGMTLSLSSTAIVLQTLQEKGLSHGAAGRNAFAVLLCQDVAVIPMLALLPLLATGAVGGGDAAAHEAYGWLDALPGWARTGVVLGAVLAVTLVGRYLVRPAFRVLAGAHLRELLTAGALLLVIGIALLMDAVGLSPALGTFLAGVVLANSEYKHELEAEIEPFKGLLLGLFFISVGASVDFALIADAPGTIAGLVVGLIVVKFLVLASLARLFGMGVDQGLLFAFLLAQGGEFAFVLLSFASQQGVIGPPTSGPLVAAVAVSMGLSPLLLLVFERWVQPRVGTRERDPRAPDLVDVENPVLIAGFGRFGHIVGRLLIANGVGTTVLDSDADQVELFRRLGVRVFYGDASRVDLLRAAGAEQAKLLVVATDDPARRLALVETVKRHFPNLRILARARGRADAYDLRDAGVEQVYRETLDSSLRLGVDALRALGFRAHQAERSARKLRRHDEASVRELAALRHDRTGYFARARQSIHELEELLRAELAERDVAQDVAWDTTSLRRELGALEDAPD